LAAAKKKTPKNAIKKIEQNNRGKRKKNGGKKSRIFCDEPRWRFSIFFLIAVLGVSWQGNKKIDKKIKIKVKIK
jgi:hypothetical protein